jgi:hypothetical protein
MKLRIVLVLCAALALTVGVGTASAGNGEKNKCKNGGWQTVYRTDGTSFKNQDKCIEYLRMGGTLRPAKSASQLACEGDGGTFSTDPASNTGLVGSGFIWSCNGLASIPPLTFWIDHCLPDGGTLGTFGPSGKDVSCWQN